MQKLKSMFLTLAASSSLLVPALAAPVAVYAQIGSAVCDGANNAVEGSTDADCTEESGTGSITSIVQTIVNIFSIIIGAVAVIMIIYGGFRYITSGGDSNGVTAAKNTILYAVVGLIIVVLAQILVRFVIGVGNEAADTATD